MFHPFRTLSKKNSAFWRKFFSRLVEIAFTCPEEHREDHFLERNILCMFWTLIETKSTLWKKFSTGSSKLYWTSPEIHSAGTMFQKKFLQSISGFERIISGSLTKLFRQIFYNCIYLSRRTTWGLLIYGKNSFFIFFWPCPKQNQPYGIFLQLLSKLHSTMDHRSFLRKSFFEKKPFSSISDNERNNFSLLEKLYQQVVITAQYMSRETFSANSFFGDFELLPISRCWAEHVPPCSRKIFAGLSMLH